jgi:hypothetical protein
MIAFDELCRALEDYRQHHGVPADGSFGGALDTSPGMPRMTPVPGDTPTPVPGSDVAGRALTPTPRGDRARTPVVPHGFDDINSAQTVVTEPPVAHVRPDSTNEIEISQVVEEE